MYRSYVTCTVRIRTDVQGLKMDDRLGGSLRDSYKSRTRLSGHNFEKHERAENRHRGVEDDRGFPASASDGDGVGDKKPAKRVHVIKIEIEEPRDRSAGVTRIIPVRVERNDPVPPSSTAVRVIPIHREASPEPELWQPPWRKQSLSRDSSGSVGKSESTSNFDANNNTASRFESVKSVPPVRNLSDSRLPRPGARNVFTRLSTSRSESRVQGQARPDSPSNSRSKKKQSFSSFTRLPSVGTPSQSSKSPSPSSRTANCSPAASTANMNPSTRSTNFSPPSWTANRSPSATSANTSPSSRSASFSPLNLSPAVSTAKFGPGASGSGSRDRSASPVDTKRRPSASSAFSWASKIRKSSSSGDANVKSAAQSRSSSAVLITRPSPSRLEDVPENCLPTSTSTRKRREELALSLAEQKKEEGNAYYKNKEYSKALVCYSRAIELCPNSAAYYGNRSACYVMLKRYEDALQDARESVRVDPQFAKGYIRIAKCYTALGNAAAALNALSKAEELEPTNGTLKAEKHTIMTLQALEEDLKKAYDKQDYRRVVYCCDRALEHATASRRLRLTKAECYAFLGRYSEAEELVNDILRVDQTNADALLIRGRCFYYQDNVDRAFSHFQQVLRLAPDHEKAREIYKRAKQLKTKKDEGNEAFKSSRLQEALDIYTEALSIDPLNKVTNAKLYFNKALVLVKMQKLEEAVGDCTRAIELDESYIKAYLRRAKCYMDLENYEEAVRDYEKINKMEKNREYKQLLHEAKIALKRSQRKDYYKILGVDKNANDDEIKKAYRKRALLHHPDRHSGASEADRKEQEKKFKELGEAYNVLSDPKKRARFDNGNDLEDMDTGFSDVDPNHIFQAFFGGGPGFRSGMGGMGGMGHGGMGGGGGGFPGGFNFFYH